MKTPAALQPLIDEGVIDQGHPLAQEREKSGSLSRALGGAHALREGLSRHEAAKFSEA
jgi:hypothetical protein